MEKLGLNDIRERFLQFFEGKDHLRLPSFSLVPVNDPSILLINAGMTPLKPYFTGAEKPPHNRLVTCQKCIRTPDIENVGKTARHGTFFEMLGNFSFGDYFKKDAILWAWEFVVEDLRIPEDRLFVTIYEDDDEAFEIWEKDVGLSPDLIIRMGKEDNFWEHGIGPCGPCSEIYFDRGIEKGCGRADCKPGCECDRYIEFWNLVFTQFYREEDGSYSKLEKKNIDTGLGLERLACIMQGVDNLFEVDTIRNILDFVCRRAGVTYGESDIEVSVRVITDHIRSTAMMVADGILPSNESRGYVLRRLLRRAARHGRLLGVEGAFLHEVARVVIDESGDAYPELVEKADYICKVLRIEEERFAATIDQGLVIFNDFAAGLSVAGQKMMPGDMVFKLHDTYGFPLDLTREIAGEMGLEIDEQGFEKEMEKQKKRAREALKSKESSAWGKELIEGLDKDLVTKFIGYDSSEGEGNILHIFSEGKEAENSQQGDEVIVILDQTPFYAESGGQVADTGIIRTDDGFVEVTDCRKTAEGVHLHIGNVTEGIIEKGSAAVASINAERRLAIARNHTVTHLLHRALQNVLGSHVSQAGSMVDPDRLRFDFNHFSSLTKGELTEVEREVNEKILEDLKVKVTEMTADEAKKLGAIALFGEKYGDRVRVVHSGDYSMELCGGTHLSSTAQAGLVKILGESGIAAGTRRIEALTGHGALAYYNGVEGQLSEVAVALKTLPQESAKKAEALTGELRAALKEIEQLKSKLAGSSFEEVLAGAADINGIKAAAARFDQLDMEALRNTCETLRNKLGAGVVILASDFGGKASFVAMATKDAVGRGIHCGDIVKEAARIAGGGGGGRPDMAQAGGRDTARIDEALAGALEVIREKIG